MMSRTFNSIQGFLISSLLVMSTSFLSIPKVHASPEKEFIMSCTYGVLAGTLVGAASLAFVDRPSENLQRVARGASLGLYMGIGLGYYTAYVLPKQLEKQEDKILEGESTDDPYQSKTDYFIFPLVADNNQVDGVGGFFQIQFR
jgi:hypothetical protein